MNYKNDIINFYPCLMQRLKDNSPQTLKDEVLQQKIDFNSIRKVILENIIDILNAENLEYELDSERYPQLLNSVINYGVPPLHGSSSLDKASQNYEAKLRKAITRFEPRLIPESVRVRKIATANDILMNFELEALVYWSPEPRDIQLKLDYDKQLNHFELI